MMVHDYIIIGAGVAGLYAGYKLSKKYPRKNILILEANNKHGLGGRAGNDTFYGTSIVTGAGVGRKDKDELLIRLLKELRIPYTTFTAEYNYSPVFCSEHADILSIIRHLRKEFRKQPEKFGCMTFKQFAKPLLGTKLYDAFVISQPYTDFENEDAHETLYNYDMDDNVSGWKAMKIPWKQLVEKLASFSNIHYNNRVVKISPVEYCGFIIYTDNGRVFGTKNIILATTSSVYQKLLPTYNIYKDIHTQPFLRVYGKFSGCYAEIMKSIVSTSMIVPTQLKRIIPIEPDNGVYMIAYCDNKNAEELIKKTENTYHNRDWFCRLLERSIGLPNNTLRLTYMKHYYWKDGTHYFAPLCASYRSRKDFLKRAQNPMHGMVVVGEAVSTNQGWVRGALESVNAVL
jgi:hypothetical protein